MQGVRMKNDILVNEKTHGLNDISETMPVALARKIRLPLFWENVPAGTPGHFDPHIDEYIDFHRYFIRNPDDAYIVRVSGESMRGANIFPGDLLIVDRGASPQSGDIVIAGINGLKTVKRLVIGCEFVRLVPENADYQPITVRTLDELDIWGVVTYVVSRPR